MMLEEEVERRRACLNSQRIVDGCLRDPHSQRKNGLLRVQDRVVRRP